MLMNILFITSSRIGDAVLSTGILHYMAQQYPDAKITIGCGSLSSSLFEGFPYVDKIIPIIKKPYNLHWWEFRKKVSSMHWDIIVDIRNSLVSRVIKGNKKYFFDKKINKNLHKVQQFAQLLNVDIENPPSPYLMFSEGLKKEAKKLLGINDEKQKQKTGHKILAVAPTANWIGKTWPPERFVEVVKSQIQTDENSFFHNARVAVFAAPGEEEGAYHVLKSLPEDKQIDLIAKVNPALAACCISYCDFFIGNDSGLMHCASALNVPTLGLFGPSYPQIYAPWGNQSHFISTKETFDELIKQQGSNYSPKNCGSLMESLQTQDVIDKLHEIFSQKKFIHSKS